jgi:crotonobetainyl-CoA:carnitine CoA-transferase CaiB-like acyl-CoA transferase
MTAGSGPAGPLAGVRVLDLSLYPPGMFATMLLADFGADVISVEAPRRLARGRAPALAPVAGSKGWDNPASRRAHDPLRRNKRSVIVDLKDGRGLAVVLALAARADVVTEGFRPGVADRLGLGYQQVRAHNESVIYCSTTGYGQSGPYRGFAGHDLNYISHAGLLSMTGSRDGQPAIPSNLAGDFAGGGLMSAYAIMLALWSRRGDGRGQFIDISMTDNVLYLLAAQTGRTLAGESAPEPGRGRLTGGSPNYSVYECRDGRWLAVAAVEAGFWAELCAALGRPDLEHAAADPAAARQCQEQLAREFRTRTRDEWMAALNGSAFCVSPVLSMREAVQDPHARARGMVVEVADPELGPVQQVGIGPVLSRTPGSVRRPSAVPGEHTAEVLTELGLTETEVGELVAVGVVEA